MHAAGTPTAAWCGLRLMAEDLITARQTIQIPTQLRVQRRWAWFPSQAPRSLRGRRGWRRHCRYHPVPESDATAGNNPPLNFLPPFTRRQDLRAEGGGTMPMVTTTRLQLQWNWARNVVNSGQPAGSAAYGEVVAIVGSYSVGFDQCMRTTLPSKALADYPVSRHRPTGAHCRPPAGHQHAAGRACA